MAMKCTTCGNALLGIKYTCSSCNGLCCEDCFKNYNEFIFNCSKCV